ncbi:hypothetical protein AB6A40_002437 [Gnathostoma spinigerum]|uniref:Acyl-CoA thioesterase II n=1 Tax=Gnathostoma spinigerum TaxID=75299 RepID=A0ABD6E6K1_9BILA
MEREASEQSETVNSSGCHSSSGNLTSSNHIEVQIPRSTSFLSVTHIGIPSRADDVTAGLVDTFLNLTRIDKDIFLACHLMKGRLSLPAVYGGQVIGHALVAASATVDKNFKPHSLHSYFIKTGTTNKPILYLVDRVSDRRSFCTRSIKAIQDGQNIFTCQISFHRDEPDSIVHQKEMPIVNPPDDLPDIWSLMNSLFLKDGINPAVKAMLKAKMAEISPAFERLFEFRPAFPEKCLTGDAENGGPRQFMWLRAKGDVGNDPCLHQCIAAYISDCSMLETAIKPHASKGFIPSMAFSLDHCIWMHDQNFRVDEWMLYENISPIARGSRSYIEGRLWTRDGRLILSTAQEGLIRSEKSSGRN